MLVLPVNANALTGSASITCDNSSVVAGNTVNCTLKGTVSGGEVSGVTVRIKVSNNLTLESVVKDSSWQGDDGDFLELYDDDYRTGTFNIATFSVKVGSGVVAGVDEVISLEDVSFTDENFAEVSISNKTFNLKVLSTDNTLKSLSVSGGTLTPAFSSDVTSYAVAVNSDQTTVTAVANNSNAKVNGASAISLSYGVNTVKVSVTSEAGSTKVYTLLITRPDTRSTDNSLSSLILNDDEIELVDGVLEYKYSVLEDVDTLDIKVDLNDEKSAFVEGYGARTVDLEVGENVFEIKVKAENESIRTYKLVVTRPEKETAVSSGDGNSSSDGNVSNPKTGSAYVYVVVILMVVFVGVGVYFFQRYYKTGGKNE